MATCLRLNVRLLGGRKQKSFRNTEGNDSSAERCTDRSAGVRVLLT